MRKLGAFSKLFAAFMALALVLTGCRASTSTTSGSSADGKITVGVCLSSFHAGFMTAVNQAVTDKGKELGITVNVANANGDASVQADNMQNFITQNVSAIIINPIDSNGIVPSILMANQKNIPVFIIDTNAAGGEIINRNATDNVKAGKTAADSIAEHLKAKNGDYKGVVVNLAGKISQASGADRDSGFMNEIAKYPNIKVVFRQDCEFDQEKSMNAMMDALQANATIDAVFSANDNTALGAIKAIEQANRFYPQSDSRHIYVVGIDGNPEGIQAVRDGRMDATISQNPISMGSKSIQMAYDYVKNGVQPEKSTESPQMLITTTNITSKEVQDFGLWADELRTRTGS